MKSNLILQLPTTRVELCHDDTLPLFSNWLIPHAVISLVTTTKGQILQQSFSNYLVHLDLFEYSLTEELVLDFIKDEPAMIMLMMLEGQTCTYNEYQQVTTESSCYHISYINKGHYTIKLNTGEHKLMVFTLRPDWFISKKGKAIEFKTLFTHYHDKSPGIFSLPYCALNKNIIQLLRTAFLKSQVNSTEPHFASSTFLLKLIGGYQKMLLYDNYRTDVVHQTLAAEVLTYIQNNFTEHFVENDIAEHLKKPAAFIRRIFKVAYDETILNYIIVLRMNLAMILVIRTNKRIGEISLLTGFSEDKYFSRAFKKHFHQSPTDTRKKS